MLFHWWYLFWFNRIKQCDIGLSKAKIYRRIITKETNKKREGRHNEGLINVLDGHIISAYT